MSRMARQAIVLSVARFTNYGLMLVSPVILVRMLPIAEYGSYREYLAYVTVLIGIATFSIHESMLYFIPRHPQSRWQVLRNTVELVGLSSIAVVLLTAVIDYVSGGRVIGHFLLPLSAYVLLHVNLDFWEWYWISDHRPMPVFVYTSGRLLARMAVVISAALMTHRVEAIIGALLALEAVRFVGSLAAWRRAAGGRDRDRHAGLFTEQLRFCLGSGVAVLIATLSRNIGNIAVVKSLGTVALALYSTGLYGEPVVVALRNSISAILLPEMVRRGVHSPRESAELWRSASVINCMLLMPAAVLLWHFADRLVTLVFGVNYVHAGAVLQLYSLIMLRECFDLTLPLRASSKTLPLVHSSVCGLVANGILLLFLLSPLGIRGAVIAMAASSVVEAGYQWWCVSRLPGFGGMGLLPWGRALRVLLAAAFSSVVLIDSLWMSLSPMVAIPAATAVYCAVFVFALRCVRLPELQLLGNWMRRRSVSSAEV